MTRQKKIKYFIWLHIFIMVFAQNIVPFLSDNTYHFFFKLVSIAWLIPAIVIIKLIYNTEARCAGIAFLGLTINNLLDEFFFDPTKLQINELILSVVMSIWIARDVYAKSKNGCKKTT